MKFNKLSIKQENPDVDILIENVNISYKSGVATIRKRTEDEYKIIFVVDVLDIELTTDRIFATAYIDTCRWKLGNCVGTRKFQLTFFN